MKKYRIKKETYNDTTRYFPQERFLFWWSNIFSLPDFCIDGGYETLEEAQKQLCVYCRGTMVEYLDFDPVRDCK